MAKNTKLIKRYNLIIIEEKSYDYMSQKSFSSLSWVLWNIFAWFQIVGVGLLIAIYYSLTNIDNNLKVTLIFISAILIFVSSVSLSILIIFTTWNATYQNPKAVILNILLWILMILFIILSNISLYALSLNNSEGQSLLYRVNTILFYGFNLIFLPLLVLAFLIKKMTKNKLLNLSLVCVLILYLLINFSSIILIILNMGDPKLTLIIRLAIDLLLAIIFYGLLTKKSVNSFKL